jgi:protein-glutamine gamma-glutamyltransferase
MALRLVTLDARKSAQGLPFLMRLINNRRCEVKSAGSWSGSSVPQSNIQADVIPLPQAVNNYLELCLFLLVLMGFGTLASTGSMDLPTIVLAGAAFALRGYLLAKRKRVAFSDRWTTPLTILYGVFYAADYLLLSRAFLPATVHLVLFAVVVRTFSLRRDRDYIMLAVLAFLMVLASAVLTVDSVFLLFFCGFMLLAVATFVLMEMRRSGQSAKFLARHSPDDYEHRHMAFSLARVSPLLVVMILLGATALFFFMPRMSTGYLGRYSFGTDISTGFSERVQLGSIGQIQQSNAVVMHIQIAGDNHGKHALHWRGVALANFDGRNWSNSAVQYSLKPEFGGSFEVPWLAQGIGPARPTYAASADEIIHYRVVLEPIGADVFFLAPWARRIRGSYRALAVDSGGAIYDADGRHPISSYEADSDISQPRAARLRAAGNEFPTFTAAYVHLPPIDPRIPELAAQIVGSASNEYDKAAAVERYLNTNYGYTLQLLRSPVADPLANFLFDRKKGHCEYFASSMAVILRTLKIPARVVNGFRSDEFNDVTENYIIRARNAHSWVEVYFPQYGWIPFDPTPGGQVGTPEGWERAMLYLDAAQSFWREWIISYDASHQYVLGQVALGSTRSLGERVRWWAQERYEGLLNFVRRQQHHAERAPMSWLTGAIAAGLTLVLLGNARQVVRMIRIRSLQSHPERSPLQAATVWYERMARSVAKRGVTKSTVQTPQEFLRAIPYEPLRARVELFTQAYESARFGNSVDDARRLRDLCQEVESATKK